MKNDAKLNEDADRKLKEEIEKVNMADSQILTQKNS